MTASPPAAKLDGMDRPAALPAATPSARLRQWAGAFRPSLLVNPSVAVIVGTALAVRAGRASLEIALGCWLLSCLLALGEALLNDVNDWEHGVDRPGHLRPGHPVRTGLSPAAVRAASFTCFGLGGLATAWVAVASGYYWLFLLFPLFLIAALKYTGGRTPYGHLALGEVSLFLFFGIVACGGSCFLQAGALGSKALLAASSIGLMAASTMAAQNARDRLTDGAAGKRTLAVLLGERGSRHLFVWLVATPYLLLIPIAALDGTAHPLAAVVSAPIALPLARRALSAEREALAGVALQSFVLSGAFGSLLAAGLVWAGG